MENEEEKQTPHKTPYTQLEQDRTSTTFTLESESESDTTSYHNNDDDDADFFLSQEFETDLQFLESEGSNDFEGFEEEEDDEIEVDELTYEELILLGDFIGKEKRGLLENEVSSCLHSYTYNSNENKSGIDRCVICQIEYEESEGVVAIQCEHPFHKDCISKWLQIKKACPICSYEISVPKNIC